MATTYATHADVARELRPLFPNGFNTTTQPTQADVSEEINRVTTSLRTRVIHAIGVEPPAGSDAALLIKRGVVAQVVAWVLRNAIIGHPASDVEKTTAPWVAVYRDVLSEIKMLPDLYRETVTAQRRVGATASDHQRDPVLPDDALSRTDYF